MESVNIKGVRGANADEKGRFFIPYLNVEKEGNLGDEWNARDYAIVWRGSV